MEEKEKKMKRERKERIGKRKKKKEEKRKKGRMLLHFEHFGWTNGEGPFYTESAMGHSEIHQSQSAGSSCFTGECNG